MANIARTPTYRIWIAMRSRCTNPNNAGFHKYGGRGIKVCARWQSFENFFADMGERPEGMTLEREDNDGNYEPTNCRWATPAEQSRNTRRNRMLTYAGETLCMADWAERRGVGWDTLYHRLRRHPVEVALDPGFGRKI